MARIWMSRVDSALPNEPAKRTLRTILLSPFALVPVVAIFIGLILRGSALSFLLIFGAVPIWMVTGVALTFAVFFSADSNTSPRWQLPWCRFLLRATIAVILGVYLGGQVHRWQERRARAFVEAVLPKLDEYRQRTGAFPEKIELAGLGSCPWVGWEPMSYHADADRFEFEYVARWGSWDWWHFHSGSRYWNQS